MASHEPGAVQIGRLLRSIIVTERERESVQRRLKRTDYIFDCVLLDPFSKALGIEGHREKESAVYRPSRS